MNGSKLEIDPNALTVEQKLLKAKAEFLILGFREWVEKMVKEIVDDSVVKVDPDNVRALVFSAIFNEVALKFLMTGMNPNHFKMIIDQLAEHVKATPKSPLPPLKGK